MSVTNLTARALFDPKGCRENILIEADLLDFETRPLSKSLGVSYPTLLRVLKRLHMTEKIRLLWVARRAEKKAAGK
tara:strand:+ start:1140 stop:1367 length:228 start_codon:yes stop_codon:yes gene_type:complete